MCFTRSFLAPAISLFSIVKKRCKIIRQSKNGKHEYVKNNGNSDRNEANNENDYCIKNTVEVGLFDEVKIFSAAVFYQKMVVGIRTDKISRESDHDVIESKNKQGCSPLGLYKFGKNCSWERSERNHKQKEAIYPQKFIISSVDVFECMAVVDPANKDGNKADEKS